MKKIIFLQLLLCAVSVNAQMFVSSGSTVDVVGGVTLYSNEDIVNEGTINLRDSSVLEFDADLTNDGTMNYEPTGSTTPGILKIGSGVASTPSSSGQPQSLNFNGTASLPVDEFIPFIQLDKTAGTATIDRGHVRLTQRLLSIQGTLDAQSSITGTSTVSEVPNGPPLTGPSPGNNVVARGLTFTSPDATTTAVIEESVGGQIDNVIIERFIPSNNRAFRLFASSVDLDGTIKDNLQEGGQIDNDESDNTLPLVDNPRPGYGTHVTGATVDIATSPSYFPNLTDAIATGLDITNTGNPGMYTWNSLTQMYQALENSNGGMTVGTPYALFIRGDRSLDLTIDNIQVGGTTTLRMIGDAVVGTRILGFNVNAIQDFILVANPYQAQVDLVPVLADNASVNNTIIHVYDPQLGVHGSFVTVDLTDGNSIPSSGAGRFLQPNQSFFVPTLASGALTVIFEESDKRANADQNSTIDIFSNTTDTRFYVSLYNEDGQHFTDGLLVRYGTHDDAVNDLDGLKMYNQYENIAVDNGGNMLSIDKRNINGAMENVQLNVTNYGDVNYHIEIDTENIDGLDNAYLIDHYLDTETELAEGNNVYNFTIDNTVPASKDANRFEIGINMETLGVDKLNAITELTLYPNPASESVELSLSGLADAIETVEVISVDGKLVKTLQVDSLTRYTMDVSAMATGVYVVKATTANSTFTQKLIVE